MGVLQRIGDPGRELGRAPEVSGRLIAVLADLVDPVGQGGAPADELLGDVVDAGMFPDRVDPCAGPGKMACLRAEAAAGPDPRRTRVRSAEPRSRLNCGCHDCSRAIRHPIADV